MQANLDLDTYTTSTNHSEYCAAAKAAKEPKWWEKIFTEIGYTMFVSPIDLFSDSKGCIAMTSHYAREQQERGTISISYVNTKD